MNWLSSKHEATRKRNVSCAWLRICRLPFYQMLPFHSLKIFPFSSLTDYSIASIAAATERFVRLEDLSTTAVGRCWRSGALNLSRVRADSLTEFFGVLGSGCYQTQGQRQQQFDLKHEMLVFKMFILIHRLGYQVHNQDFSLGDLNDLILRLCKILCLILKNYS